MGAKASASRRPSLSGSGSRTSLEGQTAASAAAAAASQVHVPTATAIDHRSSGAVFAEARPLGGGENGGAASAASASSAVATDARRQQEADDEALARRLMMEEFADVFGGTRQGGNAAGSRSAGGTSASSTQTARASCPSCSTPNEFSASSSSGPVTLRCGACSSLFQATLPEQASSQRTTTTSALGLRGGSGMSLQLCRRCGTWSQYPTPAPGQPPPNVLCGICGHLSQATARPRRLGGRASASDLLAEEMLFERLGGRGPMVRTNVGGQRRLVPLALLLALMAEEAEQSNAAQSSDIAALPTRKLEGNMNLGEQTKCLICLEEFSEGEDVKTLPCLHIYHQKCVETWLRTDNSCPCCKTPIGQP
eukprot:TRINITY_DN92270_c0_g1_i1.p1 TRINITY_DN92270_c0_g1~~TRINITY_DN92270_c0_g1_i1.p1  ORF type:complete len:366 (-),score=77.93 TRINITY_DN92270_c0_g1_i1:103-1200(-)